ncbi:MAG: AMP-binding protein, partial [Candidatus Lambdaproteobacteria bacterium]|nr:AMP-binding protein [Candidatus Lambdaproteobacteria bacterium]
MGNAAQPGRIGLADDLAMQAGSLTVGHLLVQQVRMKPAAIAVVDGERRYTFAEFNARVNRLAHVLTALGITRGERVAIFSENRSEYLETAFAAAKLGVILCALNWRLADNEMLHCITLTTPSAVVVSPRYRPALSRIKHGVAHMIELGDDYEARLVGADSADVPVAAQPDDGLAILYTSGTTGLPKGALISHRAEMARMQLMCIDMNLRPGLTGAMWSPLFHMAALEPSIHLLCTGGKVFIIDGLNLERLVDIVETEQLWWLLLMPGMVDQVIEAMKQRKAKPKGIQLIGAMADLVPLHQIAEVTQLLQAPYVNTFGATETGLAPASRNFIPIGVVAKSLSKMQNSMCEFRLVDALDEDVEDGMPGELAFRGPTCFSGYWNALETNRKDFRGGYFHMGDMFIRNPDGTLDFVDRVKYMIKSGG